MKFSFLGYKFSITSMSNPLSSLSISDSDLSSFDLHQLSVINSIDTAEALETIDKLSANSIDDTYSNLINYGISFNKNLIKASHVSSLLSNVKDFYKTINLTSNYSTSSYRVVTDDFTLPNLNALVSSELPVIKIRSGFDSKMVDIYNADRLFPSISNILSSMTMNNFSRIVKKYLGHSNLSSINIYINDSITRTRPLHFDDAHKSIKIFIYLSDVLDLTTGPYIYSVSSHSDELYFKSNRLLSQFSSKFSNVFLFKDNSLLPCLAPAGTIIFSDQKGFHRGFPQQKSKSRFVLVLTYV